MNELPDDLVVIYLPDSDCYVGRGVLNTADEAAFARVFATEAAASNYCKRNGIDVRAELATIKNDAVRVVV